jgi:hypothetical protein
MYRDHSRELMPIIARVAPDAASLGDELSTRSVPDLLRVDEDAVQVEDDGRDAHAAVSSASRAASTA